MARLLRLLLIDDNQDDARLILRQLHDGGYEVVWERVETAAALMAALQRQTWNVITCEWGMPECSPARVLAIVKEHGVDVPIIIVSGRVAEEVGMTAMRGGIQDFVSKRGLARLCPAIERELRAGEVRWAARQVEQHLRLGSEVATQLCEGVSLIKTSDQTIAFTNPRFDEMFGYAPGELLGRHVSVVNAPTERSPEETAREITAALAKDNRWEGEVCNRKQDGSQFWCYASISRFEHSDFGSVWVSVSRDITDRKRTEEALRESEERYRSLATATAQVVWTTNAQGEVVVDCPSWRAYTGQTEQEILGWGWMTALHPDDRARTDASWADAVQRCRVYEAEYRVRRHDGEYRDFAARGVPVLAKDGSLREWVGTCTDITDLKRAREQLHARQAELAHVLRVNTMGEMAAELAHEINQPLSAIACYAQGCCRRISAGATTPDELLPAIEEVAGQALRAGEILRRLRQLVQRQETPREDTDINTVITNAVHVLAPQARQRGIPIHVDLAAGLPLLRVDHIQIEQVIVNVMLNAIEAMPAGDPAQPEILVHTAFPENGTIEITVQDRGVGLTPAISDRMFEPFYTSKPSGLGMGLSISRSIVQRHGGRLWATNNPDRGATFHVALPIVSQKDNGNADP